MCKMKLFSLVRMKCEMDKYNSRPNIDVILPMRSKKYAKNNNFLVEVFVVFFCCHYSIAFTFSILRIFT